MSIFLSKEDRKVSKNKKYLLSKIIPHVDSMISLKIVPELNDRGDIVLHYEDSDLLTLISIDDCIALGTCLDLGNMDKAELREFYTKVVAGLYHSVDVISNDKSWIIKEYHYIQDFDPKIDASSLERLIVESIIDVKGIENILRDGRSYE